MKSSAGRRVSTGSRSGWRATAIPELEDEIGGIAAFLEMPTDHTKWEAVSFDDMKANVTASRPLAGAFGEGGAETFGRMGTDGRLREELSLKDSVAHERRANAEPSQECVGRLLTGDLW